MWETEGDLGQRPLFSVLIFSISAAANTHLSPSFLKNFLTSVVDIWHSGLPTMLPLPMGTLHPLLRSSQSAVLTRECLKRGQSDPPSWNIRPQGSQVKPGAGRLHIPGPLGLPGPSLSSPGPPGPLQPGSPLSFCRGARLGFCGFHSKL